MISQPRNGNGASRKPGGDPDYARWLVAWITSVRTQYRLPEVHGLALERILTQIRAEPESLTALAVGRLLYFCERNGLVTDKTPLADRAIQALIELGRNGPIDTLSGELRDWFRKRYFWATSTVSLDVSTLQGEDAEEIMSRYFRGESDEDPESK